MSLPSADSKCQTSYRTDTKFEYLEYLEYRYYRYSKNGCEWTSLCAPKVLQEVKVPKSFFEQLYTGWIVVVHLCCSFSLWCQMASQQSAKFRTAFLVNFVPVWGWIASPIMHRFENCFRHLLRDPMYFATHYTFRRSVCKWRHKIRKITVKIFQSVNIGRRVCGKYYARLLLTE